MALADAAAGMNSAVQQILLQKLEAQRYADHQKQIAFENARQTAGDERANRAFDYNTQRQEFLDRQNQTDKEVGFGNTLNESIPGETFLPGQSKAVGFLKTAGVPLTEAPARQAMGTDFTGPMPGDATGPETPQQAQVGRLQGFIKGASQKQIDTNTDNARQAAASKALAEREAATTTETARHNKAMENKPQSGGIVVVQGPNGPELVNKGAGTSTPVIGADGKPVGLRATGQERNRTSMAVSVGNRFADVQSNLDEAERRGLLGPTAGRVSDFLAGKVGSTGNAENDDLLGELRMNLSAVRSGFSSLHGRGGANAGIAHDIESKMDSGHMSHAELTGALRAMKKWVDDYAGKAPTDDSTATKPSAADLIKKYGVK